MLHIAVKTSGKERHSVTRILFLWAQYLTRMPFTLKCIQHMIRSVLRPLVYCQLLARGKESVVK